MDWLDEQAKELSGTPEYEKARADLLAAQLAAAEEALRNMERRKDIAYSERNRVVAVLARLALSSGYRVVRTRTAIEGWSDDWHGCVYIVLPCGQVSWHYHDSQAHLFADLPEGTETWDGHTTDEKYERLHNWRPKPSEALKAKTEECERLTRDLANVVRITGSGSADDPDAELAPDAVRAVTELQRDYKINDEWASELYSINESIPVCRKHTHALLEGGGLANECWVCEAQQQSEEIAAFVLDNAKLREELIAELEGAGNVAEDNGYFKAADAVRQRIAELREGK